MKKIIIAILAISIIAFVSVTSYKAGNEPKQVDSEVNAEVFIEDNQKYYSHLAVKTVPSYDTKESSVQEMVVVADFGAWYKGGHVHLVQCQTGKDCTKPEGRTLSLLDDRTDEEGMYYRSYFE